MCFLLKTEIAVYVSTYKLIRFSKFVGCLWKANSFIHHLIASRSVFVTAVLLPCHLLPKTVPRNPTDTSAASRFLLHLNSKIILKLWDQS